MANKTTANFIGVNDDYSGTSGAWSITEARERKLSSVHGENWGGGDSPFDLDFLVIGGGGGSGRNPYVAHGGGGAGGYLNSFGSEASGANSTGLAGKSVLTNEDFTVTVGAGGAEGANGSNSVFSGTDASNNAFTLTATGGGRGGDNQDAGNGGSGGGAGSNWQRTTTYAVSRASGDGTANQGFDGADVSGSITVASATLCNTLGTAYWCDSFSSLAGGGGGGAGGAASGHTGGAGLASSITGSSVTRAGGGAGMRNGSEQTSGTGRDQAGGGGVNGLSGSNNTGNNGTVILRYPNTLTINFSAAALTATTATDGSDKVTTFTAGSGTVSWSYI